MKFLSFALLLLAIGLTLSCADTSMYDQGIQQGQKESEEIKKIVDKTDEFANLSPPLKPQKDYKLRFPVAVVKKNQAGKYEMEGYKMMPSDKSYYHCTKSRGCDDTYYIIDDPNRAVSLDKLKTLIQVKCEKGKKVGDVNVTLKVGTFGTSVYANNCNVSVIDMDTNTTVVQKEIKAEKLEMMSGNRVSESSVIKPEEPQKDYLINPKKFIVDFLNSLRS